MQQTQCNEAVRERRSEIPELIMQIKEKMEKLQSVIHQTNAILAPVMPNTPEVPPCNDQKLASGERMEQATSDFGQSLAVVNSDINDLIRVVSKTNRDLEQTIGS